MPEKNTASPIIGPKSTAAPASTTGAVKLDRSKLHSTNMTSTATKSSDSGSARTVLTLVIVIILLAVGGAFAVRYMQNRNGDATNTDPNATITPTEAPMITEEPLPTTDDNGFNATPMDAANADPATDTTKYTDSDSEVESTDAEATFGLSGVTGQSYTDFYRITFDLTTESETENAAPAVEANYRSAVPEIELILKNTDSVELTDATWEVENSIVTMLEKVAIATPAEGEEAPTDSTFKVKLSAGTEYYVFANGSDIIVDVMETEDTKPSAEPEVEPSTTPMEEETGTSTPGNGIEGNTSANDAKISGFSFADSPEKFTYQLKLDGDKVPNVDVSTKTEEGKYIIEFKIANLAYDALPKDGVGYRDFREMGVRNVEELNLTNSNFVSTYKFSLEKQAEYKISLQEVDGANRIVIEFMH